MIDLKNRLLNKINHLVLSKIVRFLFVSIFGRSNIRFLNINPAAIGHLSIDIDLFLKERKLGRHKVYGVLLAPKCNTCNQHLVLSFKLMDGIFVIQNRFVCYALDYLRVFDETSFNTSLYSGVYGQPSLQYEVINLWGERHPIMRMHNQTLEKGEKIFQRNFSHLVGKKIVLLHCRDNLFDESTANPNRNTQSHRNSSVASYKKIIEFLNQRDFAVIRIGEFNETNNTPIYENTLNVVAEDRRILECYLAYIHQFFLGSCSGPMGYSCIWQRPLFRLNCLPYESLRAPNTQSMSLPKILKLNDKTLTVRQIYANGFHEYRYDQSYKERNISFIENDPYEALEDFILFFKRFFLKETINEDCSVAQKKFRELVPSDTFDYHAKSLVGPNLLNKIW